MAAWATATALAVMVLTVALASPPYSFYIVMKWSALLGNLYLGWLLIRRNGALLPLSLLLAVVGGVHAFAKFAKEDWVWLNWTEALCVAVAGVTAGLPGGPRDEDCERERRGWSLEAKLTAGVVVLLLIAAGVAIASNVAHKRGLILPWDTEYKWG